jgi:hypothetical protein
LQKLALFCVKNANIFAKFFGENILKIITSVPGHPVPKTTFSMKEVSYAVAEKPCFLA